MQEWTDHMYNDLYDSFSPPLHLTHAFFFSFLHLWNWTGVYRNSLKVQWSSVSGNDTPVGMLTGNIPSGLIRLKVALGTFFFLKKKNWFPWWIPGFTYRDDECPLFLVRLSQHGGSKVGQLCSLCKGVLLNHPSNHPGAPGGHARVKKLIIPR